MPKTHPDWPINTTVRVSVAQRDFLDEMASLHDFTPSEFVRGLIDNARVDAAISTIDRAAGEVTTNG